jgi:hypothetical protein
MKLYCKKLTINVDRLNADIVAIVARLGAIEEAIDELQSIIQSLPVITASNDAILGSVAPLTRSKKGGMN